MANTALQIQRTLAGTVNAGNNVIFNSIMYTSGDIGYDSVTGILTFQTPGRYVLNWNVSTQTSTNPVGVSFALEVDSDLIIGSSPSKTGQTSGTTILEVPAAPLSISLLNYGPGSCYYASGLPVTASLTVVQESPGSETDMRCFAVLQWENILQQMIAAYPSTTWSVFSQTLATFTGTPVDLYTSPLATGPGILRLLGTGGVYQAFPIQTITAIYTGDGTVYDDAFQYLPLPDPLPQSCDTDVLAGIMTYLPIGTAITSLRVGPTIAASGDVYRNEYGVLVLSDDEGNTPIFVPTPHILFISTAEDPLLSNFSRDSAAVSKKPGITLLKE